ncbi:2Fe-2S iron-sulfur cluster-binding protein [Ectobacillus funiculus]|jgi:ferredoxin|uniref:2Fe-2S iron-sulfur cluster-binding protein n=1 Tax=Ectobacillus funiculus TaxID=137993 RepID=A0ABV5WFT8_9BACI
MNKRMLTVGSLIPKHMLLTNHLVIHPIVKASPSATEHRHPNSINLLQNQIQFEVRPAKGNLLDVALEQGQALQYKCRKGTCGVCTVQVVEGASCLSSPNEKEQKKLKKGINDGYRLACQANIT